MFFKLDGNPTEIDRYWTKLNFSFRKTFELLLFFAQAKSVNN